MNTEDVSNVRISLLFRKQYRCLLVATISLILACPKVVHAGDRETSALWTEANKNDCSARNHAAKAYTSLGEKQNLDGSWGETDTQKGILTPLAALAMSTSISEDFGSAKEQRFEKTLRAIKYVLSTNMPIERGTADPALYFRLSLLLWAQAYYGENQISGVGGAIENLVSQLPAPSNLEMEFARIFLSLQMFRPGLSVSSSRFLSLDEALHSFYLLDDLTPNAQNSLIRIHLRFVLYAADRQRRKSPRIRDYLPEVWHRAGSNVDCENKDYFGIYSDAMYLLTYNAFLYKQGGPNAGLYTGLHEALQKRRAQEHCRGGLRKPGGFFKDQQSE